MFQTLLICFRKGLEGFLVIASATPHLRRTWALEPIPAVRSRLAVAVTGYAILGIASLGATEELAEGWIAQLISLALVVVPTAWIA
ncbi:hypothetical protein [Ramlibacter sp.]|uniref:hypothetical protein n=1 Tax=Ramlibacter sp. TaxID=1917967 RepID=UPI001796C89D|nr:hypothetical protein [Ramlibacter sp.]MBA2675729.1 hypothetical protein [Ramlibacter sp.]